VALSACLSEREELATSDAERQNERQETPQRRYGCVVERGDTVYFLAEKNNCLYYQEKDDPEAHLLYRSAESGSKNPLSKITEDHGAIYFTDNYSLLYRLFSDNPEQIELVATDVLMYSINNDILVYKDNKDGTSVKMLDLTEETPEPKTIVDSEYSIAPVLAGDGCIVFFVLGPWENKILQSQLVKQTPDGSSEIVDTKAGTSYLEPELYDGKVYYTEDFAKM
jgi:uncharacterized pyridoxamine 5'-phosphate oxidase family protein